MGIEGVLKEGFVTTQVDTLINWSKFSLVALNENGYRFKIDFFTLAESLQRIKYTQVDGGRKLEQTQRLTSGCMYQNRLIGQNNLLNYVLNRIVTCGDNKNRRVTGRKIKCCFYFCLI